MSENTTRSHGLLHWLLHGKRAAEPAQVSRARLAGARPRSALPERLEDQGEIGRGGMSSVRRALDRNLLRTVAIKILDPRLAQDEREAQRFREEAQITGQLDHPHIPPVYDLGTDEEGTHYFTMKLVKGRTLADILNAEGYSPSDETILFRTLEVFVKICQAVAFAHARGVVHLDIKPVNVMVGTHGQVYLMDWGIARVMGASRPSGAVPGERVRLEAVQAPEKEGLILGTLPYMAPEQAHGLFDVLDERTDVFSLGAVLYRMLVGHAPYQGADKGVLYEKAKQAIIEPPRRARPELALPRRLCDIAMKALAAEPERRYQTVEGLIADVEAFLRGEGRFDQLSFPAGALILREGEPGNAAYVVTRGRCVAFKTVDGERQVLRVMGPGDVFGEMAIFTDTPRTASVEAMEPLSLTVVTRASLEKEVGQSAWMGRFVRALAQRFRDVDERATALRNNLDDTELSNHLLRHLALHATGDASRRVAPWSPVARTLGEHTGRMPAQVLEDVRRLGMFQVDPARDELALLPAAAPPPFAGE